MLWAVLVNVGVLGLLLGYVKTSLVFLGVVGVWGLWFGVAGLRRLREEERLRAQRYWRRMRVQVLSAAADAPPASPIRHASGARTR